MQRQIREVHSDYLLSLSAFRIDPNREALSSMIEVEATGPPLTCADELAQARRFFRRKEQLPASWVPYLETGSRAPFQMTESSFVNLFSPDTALLLDIYRPPWKGYYTSDVFLCQWLRALGKEADVRALPLTFPAKLYINNINNPVSNRVLDALLDEAESDLLLLPCTQALWKQLLATPHVRCVAHILDAYNAVNIWRGAQPYAVEAVQVYRRGMVSNLKFTIHPVNPKQGC